MKQDNVIRILFVLDHVDDAEQIISTLRNAGIAVRATRASNDEELEQALGRKAPDLALVDLASKQLALEQVHKQVLSTGKDIGLVALIHGADEDTMARTAELGVSGLALMSRPTQLVAAVQQEFEALSMRRRVRQLRASLSETERRCDALLDSSNDAIAYVHEGMHVRANKAYLALFGMETFEDVEGMTLLDMIAPDQAGDFKKLLQHISKGEPPPEQLETRAERADGTEFEALIHFANASYEGEPCIQIIFRQHAATSTEMQWRDAVTGLFNRAQMLKTVDKAATEAATGRSGQAILVIEPDHYRGTLDTVGLSAADTLLHDLASVLAGPLSDRDAAGRIADHTFAIVLADYDKQQVQALAQRLCTAVEDHIFEAGTKSVNLTISVGGSLIGEKNASTQDLLDQANAQLRSSQEQGGNSAEIFNPAAREEAEAERELRWKQAIEKALANDEFMLFNQQVISLQGAENDYFEILLRLNGPNGEIRPSAFLPAAERNNLMPKVDRWVLRRAIEILAQRLRDGQPTTFLVKLSVHSLADTKLAAWIGAQLKAHKVPHQSLVVEMPESKVRSEIKPAAEFAEAIRKLGCGFALEQFGTGLKPFQMLKHIDANFLKIDRNFLDDLPNNEESQQKIREICQSAKEHDRKTIAEWVQDAASTSILFGAGVDFVQGNFLQEPEQIGVHETVA